jgi:drug/metabolite transporter (DMT)-like permease
MNDLPDPSGTEDTSSAETILRRVSQDLGNLHQKLIVQLSQDVSRLEAEKSRLASEIETLRMQYQQLAAENQVMLSQQQIAQQQVWATQMAQALANHLQTLMVQRLNQMVYVARQDASAGEGGASVGASVGSAFGSSQTNQVLSALDSSLNRTLNSLRQDLNSYQSSLSQQIHRMHTLEQQGEAILEALVKRLSQQLQTEANRVYVVNGSATVGDRPYVHSPPTMNTPPPMYARPLTPPVTNGQIPPSNGGGTPAPIPHPGRQKQSWSFKNLSGFQLGLLMVLGSTLALSVHNVVVRVIGSPSSVFNIWQMGGFIHLNLGNSLLVLWMRMLIVVPLMILVATIVYPSTWNDLKRFLQAKDPRLMRNVIGSGFFLFVSQVLIYVSIGKIGPGVAVTILFMYPIITVPLAWLLFGDRPTLLRVAVMVTISSGVVLTAYPNLTSAGGNLSIWGVSTAVISGIAFAFYLIAMQISFRKLHPVPVSVIQFCTIFCLTSLSLIFVPNIGVEVPPGGRFGLLLGGLVLGALTLIGYLMNNFGVRFMGAARASIVASTGPVLTALLARLIIQTQLQPVQWIGIIVVTVGVTALSFEKMVMQKQPPKPAPR